MTFVIGVTVSLLWVLRRAPSNGNSVGPNKPAAASCFPGLAKEIETLRALEGVYFPRGAFSADPKSDEFIDTRYSRQLMAMNEPSLLGLDDEKTEHFRFLWFRSFHAPVAVSVFRAGGSYSLTVKQLYVEDGRPPDQPIVNQTRALTPDEWMTFIELLERACFWGMPSISTEPLSEDGAWWVLEGVREGRYHIVRRQSPAERDIS